MDKTEVALLVHNINSIMAKVSTTYISLPLPETSIDKFIVYLTIDNQIEMFLYDKIKKLTYTVEFPDIPIERIELRDGRIIRQKVISRLCQSMLAHHTVVYNKKYNIWAAVENSVF